MSPYTGVTWDHPRGRNALIAAAERARQLRPPLELRWDVQSLEGFESRPIAELAAAYDLIVLDHPHLGEAIAAGALTPIDELVDRESLTRWEEASVGPSFSSYAMFDHQWAVPLDAATQVAAYRPGAIAAPPSTWPEVEALSHDVPVALSLAGPHAFLTFASICVALGEPITTSDAEVVSDATATAALHLMRGIAARAPEDSHTQNPIAMLDAMCRTTTIAYCPLVYGYVNYAGAGLRFCDAPRATDRSPWGGSTLGGTGLAVSSRCDPSPQLVDHICWLMSETAQRHFIPAHDGQPSSRDAWLDPELDRRSAGFYSGTLQTIESAWTRPRHTGFIRIQTLASETIRRVVLDRLPITDGITALRRLVADHAARGTVSVGRAI